DAHVSAYAVHVLRGDGNGADEGAEGQTVVAARMVRRDHPLVPPEEVDLAPGDLIRQRWGGERMVELTWRASPGQSHGEEAPRGHRLARQPGKVRGPLAGESVRVRVDEQIAPQRFHSTDAAA